MRALGPVTVSSLFALSTQRGGGGVYWVLTGLAGLTGLLGSMGARGERA
jgi:hypothetical protein